MKTYVDIIRELREDRDLTQKEVVQYLGTTQQVYSRYENGENELPVRHLIALCRYYHVSADYLLGLEPLCGCAVQAGRAAFLKIWRRGPLLFEFSVPAGFPGKPPGRSRTGFRPGCR